MKSQSGFHYAWKDVSPPEVLGINARNDKERNEYAVLYAKQSLQRTAKELAFYGETSLVFDALIQHYALPVVRSFNADNYSPYHYEAIALKDHDELMLFIHENDPVKQIVSSLMMSMIKNSSIRLNVYFIDPLITESKMDAWAKTQAIPPYLLYAKLMTLNAGEGEFAKLNDKPSVPALYLVREGVSTHISTDGF
jgi:integrating conjugative element protein (TIGR03759 family)